MSAAMLCAECTGSLGSQDGGVRHAPELRESAAWTRVVPVCCRWGCPVGGQQRKALWEPEEAEPMQVALSQGDMALQLMTTAGCSRETG